MRRQTGADEPVRIGIKENSPARRLLAEFNDLSDVIGDASSSLQNSNNLSLIISNREFVQGSGRAADDDHDISGSDVDDIAAFQAKSRIDNNVRAIGGKAKAVRMLFSAGGRRNAD